MVEALIKSERVPEINRSYRSMERELEHSLKFAQDYARDGHTDYVKQCLGEAEEFAAAIGKQIDVKLKNDIMRTALKRGVKRQLENAEVYADDLEIRDESLNTAETYAREILKYQRRLEDITSHFGKRMVYKIRYRNSSVDELQEKFDNERMVYDAHTLKDYKKMFKKIRKVKKKLTKPKSRGLRGWFSRFRKPKNQEQEEKSVEINHMPSYLPDISSETSPETMNRLNYERILEDARNSAKRGDVDFTESSIEKLKGLPGKDYSVSEKEIETILNTSYRNGTAKFLKKAKRHAQRGIFYKSREDLDLANYYSGKIGESVPVEEANSILMKAYERGMSEMLDRSVKMAKKGKVKFVEKNLKLAQECADYIGADFSDEKKGKIMNIAYANEIERLFEDAEDKVNQGMFNSVKRFMKTIEYDADKIGETISYSDKNNLLRTAAKKGVERELEKAKIKEEMSDTKSSKRYLRKAEKFLREILNYQRKVEELPVGNKLSYKVRYGNHSVEELQEKFDSERMVYDPKTIKIYSKLKKKVQGLKRKLI